MTTSDRVRIHRSDTSDVVVVGAGIIGCAIAYRLAQTGRRVTVLDAGPTAGSGSTGASSAIVRFHYTLADTVAMAWDSYHAWRDWPGEIGGIDPAGMIDYRPTGALLLGPAASFETQIAHLTTVGVPHEILTSADIKTRFPAIDPSRLGPPRRLDDPAFDGPPTGELSGLYTPDAGYVNDPQLAARNYQWAATNASASFRFHQRVTAVVRTEDAVSGVQTADGSSFSAPIVVNAGGPASHQLTDMAGLTGRHSIHSRPLRTETHTAPAPPGYTDAAAPVVIDPDLGTAFRPEPGARVHISGIEPECDDLEWIDDPWTFDQHPTVPVYRTQIMRTARRMPDMPIPSRPQGLAALYDVTPDWQPLLDSTDLAGFYLACGTSGNSFKTAPTIADILTHLIDRNSPPDSGVFTTTRTQHQIDLTHYQRDRQPAATRNVIA